MSEHKRRPFTSLKRYLIRDVEYILVKEMNIKTRADTEQEHDAYCTIDVDQIMDSIYSQSRA